MGRRLQSKKSIPSSDLKRKQNPGCMPSLPQPNDSHSSAPTTLTGPTSAPVTHPPQPTPRANVASASPPSASSNVLGQSHTSNPQIHTAVLLWIKSRPWISIGGLVLTTLLVIIAFKDSRDREFFNRQVLDLLRQKLDSPQGTTSAGENRVTRRDHLGPRSESPQYPSILRYLLERSLGSHTDWESDETLPWRLGLLVEFILLAFLFPRRIEKKFPQWLFEKEKKPKVDTIGWPPESPSAIFVGTKKQGGLYDIVRIDVANLSSGDRVLRAIAKYFRIWTLYETWCRLDDLRLVKFRPLPGHDITITPGESFIGEVTEIDCPPPTEQILMSSYRMERVYSDQFLFLLQCGYTSNPGDSRWQIVDRRLPLSLADLGNSIDGTRDVYGVVLGDKRTLLDKALMSMLPYCADSFFEVCRQTETPLFFWIFTVLLLTYIVHILFGLNLRGIFRRKLALAISLSLYALSRVAISDDKLNQPLRVGVSYSRMAVLSFLWWKL